MHIRQARVSGKAMDRAQTALALEVETVAELRELYRAAEARAARMRLMSTNGRQLALAEVTTAEDVLQGCAERLAYFLGRRSAFVSDDPDAEGLPIPAPGSPGRIVGVLVIDGLDSLEAIPDPEDREACRLHLEMVGATIDRIGRERELARLLADLRDREQQLEFVVGRLFSAQEEERRRVSHELHDGVAQTATALARLLDGTGSPDQVFDPQLRARLAGIARDLVGELRAVIRGLRPTILDDLGLAAGIQALADGLAALGYEVDVEIDSEITHWPPHFETALYRVAQEALTNIRKHAGGPCRVEIALVARRDSREASLRIADCGKGRVPDDARTEPGSRFGIDVMRERLTSIGGTFSLNPGRNGGLEVLASFPRPN